MIVNALCRCNKVYNLDMAFGCKQYIVELDTTINDTVLMQELQCHADLGCVKPGISISIDNVPASYLMRPFLKHALANATKCRRSKDLELTLTWRHRTVLAEDDDSSLLRDNIPLQYITLSPYGTSR